MTKRPINSENITKRDNEIILMILLWLVFLTVSKMFTLRFAPKRFCPSYQGRKTGIKTWLNLILWREMYKFTRIYNAETKLKYN